MNKPNNLTENRQEEITDELEINPNSNEDDFTEGKIEVNPNVTPVKSGGEMDARSEATDSQASQSGDETEDEKEIV